MEELPDQAFVIRYGEAMRPNDLMLSAIKHSLMHPGEFAISVNVLPGHSAEDTAAIGRRPNKMFCYTTVGELKAAGFSFGPERDDDGHTSLVLPSPPSSDDLATLAACFWGTGSNPNPVPPEKR